MTKQITRKNSRWKVSAVFGALLMVVLVSTHVRATPRKADSSGGIKHVLLISMDGMHVIDFINCSEGLESINGGAPYCPNLARLKATGINYLDTSTSKPSDSFPGLMALVSGGTPRTVGAFYDIAYDRSLNGPTITTGNGVAAPERLAAPPMPCPPEALRSSTRVSISTKPN